MVRGRVRGAAQGEFEARREEVLRAATTIFAEHGYEAASMADIAREAGISVGGLYKFAPGKEQLYLAVFGDHLEQFMQKLAAVRDLDDPSEALCEIVGRHLEHCDTHRDFFVIYVEDRFLLEWRLKEDFGERCFELHLGYLDLVTEVVRRGQRAGTLRDGDPQDLAHLLVSMINSMIFQWLHHGASSRLVERRDLIVELFLDGARARPTAWRSSSCSDVCSS